MRVRFLVPAGFSEQASGGNVYDRRLHAGLVGRGWDVAVHEVDPGGALPPMEAGELVLVDGLVASWAAPALRATRARLVPLVHMAPGTPEEGALLREAPAVLATSGWTRRWLTERDGVEPGRVHVAVPGADAADPVPGTEAGGELVCVASVQPGKGQDVLLAALGGLRDLDWRVSLVGRLDLDRDFVDALRKAAADAGIADRVSFAGALAHEEVRTTYAAADVLVLPTRAESYGMVVTEALAHGLPVVASAVGGVPEALGHAADGSAPGLLVRPDDADALAGALRRWLADPRRRRRLRRSAALRRLTLPTWSQTTLHVAAALEAAR